MQLRLNGQLATAPLLELIAKDPNDSMQIGADLGSPVVEPALPKFAGWIESVHIFGAESVNR